MYYSMKIASGHLLLCRLVGFCGPVRILVHRTCGDRAVVGSGEQELPQRQWLQIISHSPSESVGIIIVSHIDDMRAMILADAPLGDV